MKFYLLTHPRELERKTNTGQWAINCLPENVQRINWSRVTPDVGLLKLIENKKIALLHPSGQPLECRDEQPQVNNRFENFLIIDSTWQEARKITNKSPYLKSLDSFSIATPTQSRYRLRRNQPNGGLCTIECIIELLKAHNEEQKAALLEQQFEQFNQSKP